jgi:hypothetical protein
MGLGDSIKTSVPRSAAEAVIPRLLKKPCRSVLMLLLSAALDGGSASPADDMTVAAAERGEESESTHSKKKNADDASTSTYPCRAAPATAAHLFL